MHPSLERESESARPRCPSSSIGVIGAGISGLTAASQLAEHGFGIRVFDKARGVGGRTSVRREGDLQFDHGAPYFTVNQERFQMQVAAWMEAGIVKEWPARIVAIDRGRVCPGQPQTRYVGVPAMNSMAKHLSNSLPVTTGTRVISIKRRGEQWFLQDETNRELGRFDALILALPAPQAAALLTDLPEFASQVCACQLAPCWVAMAAFETPLGLPFDGAYVNDSPVSWIARDSSKPRRPQADCWVLHASLAWSAEHLEDTPKAVCDRLLPALSSAVGIDDLRPIHAATHRWRYALPVEPLSVGCVWEAATRVAVCGDWCQAGRIEGAFLSGLAAAERIMTAFSALE